MKSMRTFTLKAAFRINADTVLANTVGAFVKICEKFNQFTPLLALSKMKTAH